ncbi:MAG: flagellar biosynthetic protein FliO [Bryobacteraceae bacterium]|nr:flagellar biosynthetic protein FliO [Bryobacteraceae bacterium]MDW8380051.1 flagellar biosynthetic protein FliO [Bryobacterales bacterium]
MNTTIQILLSIVLLGLVIAVRVLAGRLTAKSQIAGRSGPAFVAVSKLTLSSQHSLQLIQFGNQYLLLALHGGGCSLISSLPAWDSTSESEGLARRCGGAV